jgi:hypothetical protein
MGFGLMIMFLCLNNSVALSWSKPHGNLVPILSTSLWPLCRARDGLCFPSLSPGADLITQPNKSDAEQQGALALGVLSHWGMKSLAEERGFKGWETVKEERHTSPVIPPTCLGVLIYSTFIKAIYYFSFRMFRHSENRYWGLRSTSFLNNSIIYNQKEFPEFH